MKKIEEYILITMAAVFIGLPFIFILFWVPSILCVALGGSVQTCGM